MKYKVLITGKNTTIIDDFFIQMDESFEVLSTSSHYGDIMRHLKYVNPDLFVYCISNETRENILQMVNIKHSMLQERIPIILIGAKEECDDFEKIAVNVANMTLVKPITAAAIQERIVKFMDERQEYKAAYVAKKEEQEAKKDAGKKKTKTKEELEAAFQSIAAKLGGADKQEEHVEEHYAPLADLTHRHHILIVDDTPMMLKTLKEYLHGEYDVATAVSGKIALKFLERKKTDLILLDYEMPDENGPEVLEKLRANDATKDIPVIFLTGVSDRKKIQEALALKPQSYLLKPIDREKLIDAITKAIG